METCKKELKEEWSRAKQLEVSLSQHQTDLDDRFEEIQDLKGQAHKNLEDTNLLNQEVTHWERHKRHLQVLLDQKDSFMQDLLDGPSHMLMHNLLKDVQY